MWYENFDVHHNPLWEFSTTRNETNPFEYKIPSPSEIIKTHIENIKHWAHKVSSNFVKPILYSLSSIQQKNSQKNKFINKCEENQDFIPKSRIEPSS